jgi:hypothetical protein
MLIAILRASSLLSNLAADRRPLILEIDIGKQAGCSSTDHGSGKRHIVIANRAMSALGQKRTWPHVRSMSALPLKADIG